MSKKKWTPEHPDELFRKTVIEVFKDMPEDAAIQVFTPSYYDEPFVVIFARKVGVPLVMKALIDKGIIQGPPEPTAAKKGEA